MSSGTKRLKRWPKLTSYTSLNAKSSKSYCLYGSREAEFEDVLLKANEEGEITEVSEKKEYKVYQRIYLSLQEDEVELANPSFRRIYNGIINYYLQNDEFDLEKYLMDLEQESAQEVTNIIMNDEKEALSNWEGQNIFVKLKNQTIAQYVSETILSIRWFLVDSNH
jgi:DNA primase